MSVAGRKMLRQKLDDNWRYGTPDDESIECAAKVFDMQSDARSFIFGLENGTIEASSVFSASVQRNCKCLLSTHCGFSRKSKRVE